MHETTSQTFRLQSGWIALMLTATKPSGSLCIKIATATRVPVVSDARNAPVTAKATVRKKKKKKKAACAQHRPAITRPSKNEWMITAIKATVENLDRGGAPSRGEP
jgi:hypothetical protein